MKKSIILVCLFLCACGGLSKQQIKSDLDNQKKITEIQMKIDSDIQAESKNNTQYTECVKQIEILRELNSKKSISTDDFSKLNSIYDTHYASNKWCSFYVSKSEYTKELENYCHQKYSKPANFGSLLLFPFRLANFAVSLATLGIFPWVQTPSEANVDKCTDLSKKLTISDKTVVFSDKEAEQLNAKIKKYCEITYEIPRQKLESQMCGNELTRGCLMSFEGQRVATFGTRDNGVITQIDWFENGFVYDNNDYYDGQKIKTHGYYYQYVGNYDDTIGKYPAFKRSKHKVVKPYNDNKWCIRYFDK